MRRFLSLFFGLTALGMGWVMLNRDRDAEVRPFNIALNELPWLPASLGFLAALLGLAGKRPVRIGAAAGLIGAVVSLKSLVEYQAVVQDIESAMKAGLGHDYETQIPPVQRLRLPKLPAWMPESPVVPQARLWRDIVFASPEGKPLKLDIYQPMLLPPPGIDLPAIIMIHGGSWQTGDRGGWFEPHARWLTGLGYVVFDIQYRLAPADLWPAQLEDVHAAIRWVKSHAAEYHADPNRIALLGRSAGGHLALMAAMRAGDQTRVQAVVSYYAPAEFKLPGLLPSSPIPTLIGGTFEEKPELAVDASPVDSAKNGLPPILLIHGLMDNVVHPLHSERLVNALSVTDCPVVLLRLPWSRHGFDAVLGGLGGRLVDHYLARFLAWSLYRGEA